MAFRPIVEHQRTIRVFATTYQPEIRVAYQIADSQCQWLQELGRLGPAMPWPKLQVTEFLRLGLSSHSLDFVINVPVTKQPVERLQLGERVRAQKLASMFCNKIAQPFAQGARVFGRVVELPRADSAKMLNRGTID